jgi:hypothetical protein
MHPCGSNTNFATLARNFSMMVCLPVDVFCVAAIRIIAISVDVENKTHLRLWKEHFGVSPVVVCIVWNRMSFWRCLPAKCEPKHLLWTLLFLKVYATERILATQCGCNPETYRQWVKLVLEGLNRLEPFVVSRSRSDS